MKLYQKQIKIQKIELLKILEIILKIKEAEAEAQKLAADAAKYAGEKEAEANKALAESLTEALIKYYEALGWDGKLPETVVSGTDTILPVLGGGTVNTPAEGSN